ncbi:MAG: glycosyltransferase [Thermodesulfobacteriota bacterium]|nr:glycosyltransferase [Thermodesulfobacteriota bacterium]
MVSIIIITLGQDEHLINCIASIRENAGCDYEIIVVNNFATSLNIPDKDITIIENRQNLGFARAANMGIRIASGEFVLLLNADTLLITDVITPAQNFMKGHPRAGVCGIQLVFGDRRLQNSVDVIPTLTTQLLNKALLKIIFPVSYPSKRSKFTSPVEVPSVIGAFMMIRRCLIDEIGLLDEGFFFYLEETDFCKRATDHGFEVWHLPGLKIVHYQGLSARRLDTQRKIEFYRSLYRFFLKHKGIYNTIMLYIGMLLKLSLEIGANLLISFIPDMRKRLKRSFVLLLWHLIGMPSTWGLEDLTLRYKVIMKNGYKWFLAKKARVPPQIIAPNIFMESSAWDVMNRSRTTFVKRGYLDRDFIYLKRYNFKGIKDTIKNVFRKSRALNTFEGALVMDSLGMRTPMPVFACEKRVFRVLINSFIATYGLNALNLVEYVEQKGISDEEILALSHYVRHIHEMGLLPVDLKGDNILVSLDKKEFFLIDLDRLKRRHFLGIRQIAKNLSYLNASLTEFTPLEKRMLFFNEYIKGNTYLEAKKDVLLKMIDEYTKKRLEQRYSA